LTVRQELVAQTVRDAEAGASVTTLLQTELVDLDEVELERRSQTIAQRRAPGFDVTTHAGPGEARPRRQLVTGEIEGRTQCR
jgi:hypothetical protein